jgi:hypothetical protein
MHNTIRKWYILYFYVSVNTCHAINRGTVITDLTLVTNLE